MPKIPKRKLEQGRNLGLDVPEYATPRMAAQLKRCVLLMEPPRESHPGYKMFKEDPSAFQETYGCDCTERDSCWFKSQRDGKPFGLPLTTR